MKDTIVRRRCWMVSFKDKEYQVNGTFKDVLEFCNDIGEYPIRVSSEDYRLVSISEGE